jgi:hypothetical protein
MKRTLLPLLLALSACNENLSHTPPPMDHFFFPAGLVLTPVAGTNQPAMLVVSANFDLRYDRAEGATVLSVDPGFYDEATGTGGSAGRPGGALVKLGPGAQMGSYAGPLAVADATTCPGLLQGAVGFAASRYTDRLYQFPIGPDGSVAPCNLRSCEIGLEPDLIDPATVAVACRSDGLRRSVYVGYLRSPPLGAFGAGTAWLSEFDIDHLGAEPRTFPLAPGPVGDMAYDAQTDRLYAVGRFAGLYAPFFMLDLSPCSYGGPGSTTCPVPTLQSVDLWASLAGAELVGVALSNPQPGVPRRAYVSARVYDPAYAVAYGGRPGYDVGGALLVLDIEDDIIGQPAARVLAVVPIGLGAGAVRVLPVRPGLADLVVVMSSGDGTIQLYDDEAGAVVRVISIDETTGAPEAGHVPYAAAVQDLGAEALVYIASFRDWTVSVLRVPLADPTSADLVRHTTGQLAGKPIRIGSPQP